jgi:predicted DNA binding protein
MRKLTVQFRPFEEVKEAQKQIFEKIQSYEILEMLKVDFEEGLCVDLIEVLLKEGESIHDVKSIDKMEIMSVLKSDGNKHTCLVKFFEEGDSREINKEFDLDLILTTPTIVSQDICTVSYIGENENLQKFVEIVKTQAGTIVNMSFTKASYQKHDILSVLTDKQKEILIAANHYGYYDFPKKITSEQLSKKVNISRPTLIQHLRKAEGRIMSNILVGHPLK